MIRKLVVGVILSGAVTLGVTLPAAADPTCYTGCTPGPPGLVGSGPGTAPSGTTGSPSPPAFVPAPTESVQTSGGLPFTGADIGESVGIACVLLVAGGALVRTNRRRPAARR